VEEVSASPLVSECIRSLSDEMLFSKEDEKGELPLLEQSLLSSATTSIVMRQIKPRRVAWRDCAYELSPNDART
jgi:hypothetical protein